ncbi:MAG: hypothetical protein AABX11_06180 [Nanoarchaeota archaeon]
MKSRGFSIFLVFAFAIIMLSAFVVAQADLATQANQVIQDVVTVARPVLETVLGKISFPQPNQLEAQGITADDLLIGKLLLSILVFAMVYYAARQVPTLGTTSWAVWVITSVVSLLFARFLAPAGMILFAAFPSKVLGVALATILPFILFFFFVESMRDSTVRNVAWIFFSVLFIGLTFSRWDDFAGAPWNYGYIYLVTAFVSLLVLWQDKRIHAYFLKSAFAKYNLSSKGAIIADCNAKIVWAQTVMALAYNASISGWNTSAWGNAPSWIPASGNKDDVKKINQAAKKFIEQQWDAIDALNRS